MISAWHILWIVPATASVTFIFIILFMMAGQDKGDKKE